MRGVRQHPRPRCPTCQPAARAATTDAGRRRAYITSWAIVNTANGRCAFDVGSAVSLIRPKPLPMQTALAQTVVIDDYQHCRRTCPLPLFAMRSDDNPDARYAFLPITSGVRSRQHQSIFELYELPDTIGVNNFKARQPCGPVVQVNFARLADHVIQPVKRDIHDIVARVVSDAKQRQPAILPASGRPNRARQPRLLPPWPREAWR